MYLYGKNSDYEILKIADGELSYLSNLLEFAEQYNLRGNLWRHYIAYLIMMDENAFSLSLERRNGIGNCEAFAFDDINELYGKFFDFPDSPLLAPIFNYFPLNRTRSNEDIRKGDLIFQFSNSLTNAADSKEFYNLTKEFYICHGVGFFGINKAFYMKDNGDIVPVSHIKDASFEKIMGYDTQKKKLITNTEAFVNGKNGNNVLLYGDSGTGKSTSIKAVLNQFFDKGLRMIQIQKHQFVHLSDLTETLKSRNYRFVLYMDDLSFEDFEIEYKYLKAAIEGGLQEKPDNVLIYATSNRRHIIKETFTEREGGDDIHRNESIQEKISLSERFGLMIYYPKPTQQEFFEMAIYLAARENISIDRDTIIAEARKWGVSHGSLSGRAAEQFVTHLKTLDL
ncbi:MAG: ATP-binding protein [Clostridia bacterium]|nr:ATP-binding protein [Clostridia bacterium]